MRRLSCFALLSLTCLALPAVHGGNAKQFARWEKDIAAFEKRPGPTAAEKCYPVRRQFHHPWLELDQILSWSPNDKPRLRWFADRRCRSFRARIIAKYQPRIIVFYSGDNDINAGKKPEQVAADFQALVAFVQKTLPKTKLIVLSIKPSPSRWKLYDKMKQANRMIADVAKKTANVTFLDVGSKLLGARTVCRARICTPRIDCT